MAPARRHRPGERMPPQRRRFISPAEAVLAGVPEGNPYHAGDGRVLIARAARPRRGGGPGLIFTLLVWLLVLRRLRAEG